MSELNQKKYIYNCYNGSNKTLIIEHKEVCPLCFSEKVKIIPEVRL